MHHAVMHHAVMHHGQSQDADLDRTGVSVRARSWQHVLSFFTETLNP